MLKVVSVVDKEGTALDRLAKGVAPYHSNLNYSVVAVHPKRPSPEQLEQFVELAVNADIIDFQYYRTAMMLMQHFDFVKDKKLVLTHNNPYSIFEHDWHEFDAVVANNRKMKDDLKGVMGKEPDYIPLAVDAEFWTYNADWKPNKTVIMVANRIESKKGILPVATACADLGLKLVLVGAISDPAYHYDIMQTGAVEFYEQISDEKLRELYHSAGIFVCNSVDDFESGTLPLLEAMLCGVPVLTRMVGHVPDLYQRDDGGNMMIQDDEPDEVTNIISKLEDMLNDKKAMGERRERAWAAAKGYNMERRAYAYQKLYRSLVSDATTVSIIMPISDNADVLRRTLEAVAQQDYPNIELVVCDDGAKSEEALVRDWADFVSFPVRYIYTGDPNSLDYGLARARNTGIVEATGEILVFCDQRMIMESDAVSQLVKELTPRHWVYGNKGGGKKDFVENFSAVYRSELIQAGMFCERINEWGGMSQEIRGRIRLQGITTEFVEAARATPAGKSRNKFVRKGQVLRMKNKLWKMGL